MSRNKKILIGVGVVVMLGAIAFANFKFKRNRRRHRQRPRRSRSATSRRSCRPRARSSRSALVNISADTMGRVTDLAVNEGDRVKKGQFLLQIDPRNLRRAVQRTEALAGGRASRRCEQLRLALESARVALEAGGGKPTSASRSSGRAA